MSDVLDRPYLTGPGWWELLDNLFEQVKSLDPNVQLDFKEKHGICQVDFTTESTEHFNEIAKLTVAAEAKSASICELCGCLGGRVDRQNWYMTLCDRCAALSASERREMDRKVVEHYHRKKAARLLFGILPTDADKA